MPRGSIRNAALISIAGKYGNIIINLVYSGILARILSPSEFGVVAIILVFTTFFTILGNIGIGPAIIQNKDINNNDKKSLFALTFYFGIAIALFFSILSYPISLFYDNFVYINIGLLLSISLFFNTLNIVPNALLLKEHKFKLIAYRTIIISIFSALPTIYLAIIGFSYYSIVFNSIFISIMTFLWNFITSNIKIGFRINKSSITKILEFSKNQYFFSLINYFSRNIDNILIGRFLGDASLGYYNRSYKLMLFPVHNLTHAITPVLHPILSEYHNQKDKIYKKYIKVVKTLSLTGIFIMTYSFFASKELMLIIFGDQWFSSIKSLQILSLSLWAQMIISSSGSIFQSLNKTKLLLTSGILIMLTVIPSIILGIIMGDINDVALFVMIAYNINFFHVFYILIKFGFKYNYIDFLKLFRIDFLILLILFFSIYIYNLFFNISSLYISAISKFIFLSVVYICSIYFTNQNVFLKSIFNSKK